MKVTSDIYAKGGLIHFDMGIFKNIIPLDAAKEMMYELQTAINTVERGHNGSNMA